MVVLTRKFTYRTTGNAAATAHRVLPFQSVLMLARCVNLNAQIYTCRLVWSCSGVVRKQFTTAQNILKVSACCCSNTRHSHVLTSTAAVSNAAASPGVMAYHTAALLWSAITVPCIVMDCRLHGCILLNQAHTLYCACFNQLC